MTQDDSRMIFDFCSRKIGGGSDLSVKNVTLFFLMKASLMAIDFTHTQTLHLIVKDKEIIFTLVFAKIYI